MPELDKPLGRRQEDSLSAAAIWVVALGCLLLAAILLFLSFAPYEVVLRTARLATGSGNPLSRSEYAALLPRILVGGCFYGALGIVLLALRPKVCGLGADAIGSLRIWVISTCRGLVETLRNETRWHLMSLALVVVIGAALRIYYVDEPPRYDESFTYLTFARRSLAHVFTYYPAPNNHILHSALVWLSCRIFGNSLAAMRLPALFCGILLVPAMYVTGRFLGDRNTGLWAAGLMAISGPFVLYSVNARGYGLQALLLVFLLYVAAKIIAFYESPDTRDGVVAAYWVLFCVASIAGFWTAPTMLYSYLTVCGWLLWAERWRIIRPLVISGVVTAIAIVALYMPVVVVSGPNALLRNPWVQPLPWREFRTDAHRFPAELLTFLHGGDPLVLAVLVGVGVVVSLWFGFRTARHYDHPLVILFLVLLVLPAVQRIVPFPRVLLPLFVVYYVSAAMGLSRLAGQRTEGHESSMAIALGVAVAAIAFHLTGSGYIESYREFPDSRAVANYLTSHLGPCDRLIVSLSAGAQLSWELNYLRAQHVEHVSDETAPGRVLVAMQRIDKLPPRGNGLLNPSDLTFEGTLRLAGLNTANYQPARLIYQSGEGEVFELLPLHPTGARAACDTR